MKNNFLSLAFKGNLSHYKLSGTSIKYIIQCKTGNWFKGTVKELDSVMRDLGGMFVLLDNEPMAEDINKAIEDYYQ